MSMLGMPLAFVNRPMHRQRTRNTASSLVGLCLCLCFVGVSVGCQGRRSPVAPRRLNFYQTWQLQTGSTIAGYRVNSGLGDIGIDLQGGKLYAPYSGKVQPHTPDCVLFSTAQLPAYLFRVCGLRQPHVGTLRSGQAIGSGTSLQVAALRKQPNGTWAFVEPSTDLLAKMLHQP